MTLIADDQVTIGRYEPFYVPFAHVDQDLLDLTGAHPCSTLTRWNSSLFAYAVSAGDVQTLSGQLRMRPDSGSTVYVEMQTDGLTTETSRTMNFDALWPRVDSGFTPSITKVRVRVRETGDFRLELLNSSGVSVYDSGSISVASPDETHEEELTLSGTLTDVRRIRLSVDDGELFFVGIDTYVTKSAEYWWDYSCQCLGAQMQTGFVAADGSTNDKTIDQQSAYQAASGTGMQALVAALMWKAGWTNTFNKNVLIDDSIGWLLNSCPRHTTGDATNIFIHFADGTGGSWTAASGSEYSVLDTALAVIPAYLAAIIGERDEMKAALLNYIQNELNLVPLESGGGIQFGYENDGTTKLAGGITYSTLGEETLISILRNMQDPTKGRYDGRKTPNVYQYRGWIGFLLKILCRYGKSRRSDIYGIDWKGMLEDLRIWQKKVLGSGAWNWGYSEGWFNTSTQFTYPSGAVQCGVPAKGGNVTFDGEATFVVADVMMALAELDPDEWQSQFEQMQTAQLWSTVTGPYQSWRWTGSVAQEYPWQNHLRAFFAFMGQWQFKRYKEGQTNEIDAVTDSTWNAAIRSAFFGPAETVTLGSQSLVEEMAALSRTTLAEVYGPSSITFTYEAPDELAETLSDCIWIPSADQETQDERGKTREIRAELHCDPDSVTYLSHDATITKSDDSTVWAIQSWRYISREVIAFELRRTQATYTGPRNDRMVRGGR